MFKDAGNGSIEIYGLSCFYPKSPPDEEIDGYFLPKEQQKFIRTVLPKEWKIWRAEEAKYLKSDPDYCHTQIEDFVRKEWIKRLKGYWYYNNGAKTYITGTHYMYINWWKIDIGYPDFRWSDLKYFYFLQYCIEDPDCLGMIQIAMRRDGKTYKGGLFLYEGTSRTKNAVSGIQSKTGKDAEVLFTKCLVTPFKHLPDFFRPNFDTSAGNTPKKQLLFQNSSKRGKAALEDTDDELESMIDFRASSIVAYDGQKLFRYLCDEAGKTEEVDVSDRHDVVQFCSMLSGGKIIIGKQLITSTVEELDKGGAPFKKLWDMSDHTKKTGNNRTKSGLYRFFTPANESMELDEYGIPNIEKANEWLDNSIFGLMPDKNAVASFRRKNPRTEEEAFYIDGKDCVFNAGIINERLSYLESKHIEVPGDFHWKDGVVDGEVVFIPDENAKKWRVCALPELQETNAVTKKFDNTYQKSLFSPLNDHKFRIAVDPIDHAKSTKSSDKGSEAAIYVFRQFDPQIDNPLNVDNEGRPLDIEDSFGTIKSAWKTYNFWAEYIYRPDEPLEFYEDVIKAIKYYGCKILIESQKPGLINHLKARGYSNFLMTRPQETFTSSNGKWGTNQDKDGIPASKMMISHYTGLMQSYIVFHGHRCNFKRLLQQALKFTPDKPTEFDAVVAAGNCLIASEAKIIAPKFEVTAINYFKKYVNGKRIN